MPELPARERQRIRRAFDGAAHTYDQAADLQRLACERLMRLLAPHAPENLGAIVDAGCGTGYGSRLLLGRWPEARLVGLDFSGAMLARAVGATPRLLPVCADIHALPLKPESVDLYWASLSLQWCALPQALAEARRVLAPGGLLACNTLGAATLQELRRAFDGIDAAAHALPFHSRDKLRAKFDGSGLHLVEWQPRQVEMDLPDVAAVLRSLKAIGANQVGNGRRQGLLGRRAWQTVQERYEALRRGGRLPVTYELIYVVARKP